MLTKNITKYFILTAVAALWLYTCATADAQSTWTSIHQPARNLVWPNRLKREIGFLTDTICDGRATGTRGGVEAGAWISRQFGKAGLIPFGSTWFRSFRAENGTVGHNVIGLLPGSSKRHPEKYIIVAAHHDHIGNINGRLYPGADANASGVVAMTSIAKMMDMTKTIGRSYLHNVIFVGLDGRELDKAGSKALWNMIANGELHDPVSGRIITKEKIVMMINIDQIGSTLSPLRRDRKDYMIMLDGSQRDNYHKSTLRAANVRYDLDLDLGFTYYDSENFTKLFYGITDQKVFAEHGIPAVMLTSGITMNNNKTWDNVGSLDMDVFIKRIYLIYHWLLMMI